MPRPVLRVLSLCPLLLASVVFAQNQPADQNTPAVVRVGVAVMQNTSTRPIATRVQRDRLVQFLNRTNPKHPKTGQPKIEAIALEGDSPDSIGTAARDRNCEYVVFTELTELRAPGDPNLPDRPGTITIGRDPLADEPGLPTKQAPVHFAVVEFRIMHSGVPIVASSVSGKEPMEADATVSQLMSRIADRVHAEVIKPAPAGIQ